MQFGNLYRPDECEDCCPECAARTYCGPAHRRLVRLQPSGWESGRREAGFDHLLTDYDQILLQFGMHILWKP